MSALHDTFEEQSEGARNISRRGALRSFALGGAAAFALASLPGANDAQAGEAKAATTTRPSEMMTEMLEYSEDPETRGIGLFINWQENAPEWLPDHVANLLKEHLAERDIPLDVRHNHSEGTATDLTFYVSGYPFELPIEDVFTQNGVNEQNLEDEVLAHHRDIWAPIPRVSALDQS